MARLSELVEDLKRNLDIIVVMPDGRLLVYELKTISDTDEAVARAEVERTALSNEELDAVDRPVSRPRGMGQRARVVGCPLSTARSSWCRWPTVAAMSSPTPP